MIIKWKKMPNGSRFIYERHRATVGGLRLWVEDYGYDVEWRAMFGSYQLDGTRHDVPAAKAAARRAVLAVLAAADSVRAASP